LPDFEPEAEADICGKAELADIQLCALAWFKRSLADITEGEFLAASVTHCCQLSSSASKGAARIITVNNNKNMLFFIFCRPFFL
jgi:hypothetical protein